MNEQLLLIFLDVDGVINDAISHDEYFKYFNELEEQGEDVYTYPDSDEFINKINTDKSLIFGLWANEQNGHGEIYSKHRVKQLVRAIKETNPNHQVIFISSGSDILKNDPALGLHYWKEIFGFNCVDWFVGGGSAKTRHKEMLTYLKHRFDRGDYNNLDIKAIMLEDMADLPEDTKGYLRIRHTDPNNNPFEVLKTLYDTDRMITKWDLIV